GSAHASELARPVRHFRRPVSRTKGQHPFDRVNRLRRSEPNERGAIMVPANSNAMLLVNKVAVVYGAGGAVGGAVSRVFAREGAKVFLTGRTLAKVDAVAREIIAAVGVGEAAQIDALDEGAVDKHLDEVVAKASGIDISFNAVGLTPQRGVQGIPLSELSVESFLRPITMYTHAHFV